MLNAAHHRGADQLDCIAVVNSLMQPYHANQLKSKLDPDPPLITILPDLCIMWATSIRAGRVGRR